MKKSEAIAALGALAQESRLDIFRLLVERGPRGIPAGEIGERLKLPSPTLSFHLNQLRYAGLVHSRRASRSIIYRPDLGAMNALTSYLTEKCCGGHPELCAPALPGKAPSASERGTPGGCAPGRPDTCGPASKGKSQARASNRKRARATATSDDGSALAAHRDRIRSHRADTDRD